MTLKDLEGAKIRVSTGKESLCVMYNKYSKLYAEEDIKADIVKTCGECKNIVTTYHDPHIGNDPHCYDVGCGGKDPHLPDSKPRCERCKSLMEWAGVTEKEIS